MKRIFLIISLFLLFDVSLAQGNKYDSAAIFLMDRMSDVIGDLEACSFTVNTAVDDNDFDHGMVRHYGTSEVHMLGPDKMLVITKNKKGHRQYMYNGTQLAYYSFTENNYGMIDAPPTIMEAIDKIHLDYGIDFPAADFFYPTFTDDMIALFDEIRYLGIEIVDGKECFHLLARNKDRSAQVWINNDAFTLPAKMLIVDNTEGHPQIESTYSNWHINPVLPDAMFDFLPPAGATRLTIVAKNEQ